MEMVRNGTYNEYVEANLPFQHRTGVILRKDLWTVYPENKENIFEGLGEIRRTILYMFLFPYRKQLYNSQISLFIRR